MGVQEGVLASMQVVEARPIVSQIIPKTASAAPITIQAMAMTLEFSLQKLVIWVQRLTFGGVTGNVDSPAGELSAS